MGANAIMIMQRSKTNVKSEPLQGYQGYRNSLLYSMPNAGEREPE